MEMDLGSKADLVAHRILAQSLADGFRASPTASVTDKAWVGLAWETIWDVGRECGQKPETDSIQRILGSEGDRRRSIHDQVFGLLISKDCPPYETEYLPLRDTTYLSQQMADISGFYRAFGLEPDKTRPERVDHLSLELDFVGHLLTRMLCSSRSFDPRSGQHFEVAESALKEFFECHLGRWVSLFAKAFDRRIETLIASVPSEDREDLGHYRQFGLLLNRWVESICRDFGIQPTPITSDEVSEDPFFDKTASFSCEGCTNL